jgi:hypothetical protein
MSCYTPQLCYSPQVWTVPGAQGPEINLIPRIRRQGYLRHSILQTSAATAWRINRDAITSCEIRRLFKAAWEIRWRNLWENLGRYMAGAVAYTRNGKGFVQSRGRAFYRDGRHLRLISVFLFPFPFPTTVFLAFLLTSPPSTGLDYQSCSALWHALTNIIQFWSSCFPQPYPFTDDNTDRFKRFKWQKKVA